MFALIFRKGPRTASCASASRVCGFLLGALLSSAWLAAGTLASPAAYAQADNGAADELMRQAQTAMSKGRPEEAISLLSKAIDKAPDRPELYILRSRARDSAGKFDAALQDASKYIELTPNEAYGYLNRARVYLSLEKPESAMADANKAIELAPDEPDGYYRRADVFLSMNKEAEAQADEAKADELDRQAAAR